MDDLATLNDITGPAVLNALSERFHRHQFYTYFGDFLLSFNPGRPFAENETQVGQWYRKSKPLDELPPHVLAVAHRVYRMLLTDFTPQTVLLTGRSGSGKTYAARSIVNQLMREARLSPLSGLGPRMIMAQHVLKTLVTTYCPASPVSTRTLQMTTLYCRPDGKLVSGEVCALCLDKWRLVERPPGCGSFAVFYSMMAGMTDTEVKRYYLMDRYRLLDRHDGSPNFLGPEDHRNHVDIFDFFMTAVGELGLDLPVRNYAGQETSALLAVLAAILHLGNVHVTAHAQTGQAVVANHQELRAVADLLSLRPDQLEAALLYTTTFVRGETVQTPTSADKAGWLRDSMAVEVYRRLVSVVTGKVNNALMPHPENVDHGALNPVTVVEAPAREDLQPNRLETFIRNMAAERIQRHLHDLIFQRDVDACEQERIQAYKIKFADNTELIDLVFKPEGGILTNISRATSDPRGSPEALVSALDKDRTLKKSGCYVSSGRKGHNTFIIQHSAGQVTYDASDFLSKNHGVLPENIRQLLLHSGNPLVVTLATVTFQSAGYPPEYLQPESFYAINAMQGDISYLLNRLDNSTLHYVRCLRPNTNVTSPALDQAELTSQLKEACVVEVTRQRKFGYSACMTQQEFVRSFRTLAFSTTATITSLSDACAYILEKAGLRERGPVVTTKSVFLFYWHVQRLHALKAEDLRRIILMQSLARRFLVRRRMGGRMTSQQHEAAVGEFCDYVSHAGAWAFRAVQAQADYNRNTFEAEQVKERAHHQPLHHRNSNNYSGGDSYTGERHVYDCYVGDSFHSHSSNSSRSPRNPDDQELFYDQVVGKVLASQDSLSDDTWAKIIYMERGRQVAKVYVEAQAVIVDGSKSMFDGERFGLGACRNEYRDEETAFYRQRIEEGVRFKRDPDGSVWACRLCDQPIIVKGPENSDVGCLSADVLIHKGQLPQDKPIKIWDMKEFRSKVALDLKHSQFSRSRLRRACIVGLSFGRDEVRDVQTACWLCVVNVKALQALDSDEIIREAQLQTAQMQMASPEDKVMKRVEDGAKGRMSRSRWAKTDQREHLQEKEAGARHMRMQLREKGFSVGEHVGYSWENTSTGDRTTMEALQQWVEPEMHAGRSRGPERVRSWAKVETAFRDQRNKSQLSDAADDGFGVRPDYD